MDGEEHVSVPVLATVDKETVGAAVFETTVTIFPAALVEQPLAVLVTTALQVPAKLNVGFAVVAPEAMPEEGLQLYVTGDEVVVIATLGVGLAHVIDTVVEDNVAEGIAASAVIVAVPDDVQPFTGFVTTTLYVPLPLAVGFELLLGDILPPEVVHEYVNPDVELLAVN